MSYSIQRLIIPIILLSVLLVSGINAKCNCVGCQYNTHVVGSADWCRCCRQTFDQACLKPYTNDTTCRSSVYENESCLSNNYVSWCPSDPASNQVNSSISNAVPPAPVTFVEPVPSPVTNETIVPRGEITFVIPVVTNCNCVGCQYNTHVVGGDMWCRCCQQTFNPECANDETCNNSVYEVDSCLSNNFVERCISDSVSSLVNSSGNVVTPAPPVQPPVPREFTLLTVQPTLTNCNCVGCQYDTHVVGGGTWCRCCRQTFNPECASDATCSSSVYESESCLLNNYDELCPESTNQTTTREATLAPSVSPSFYSTNCNCVGCQYSTHVVGGGSWCRCCRQTFNPECAGDTTCSNSVYESESCLLNNYDELCAEDNESTSNQTVTPPREVLPPAPDLTPAPTSSSYSSNCNCVGCQYSTHVVGGKSWCRCCRQTFNPACVDDETCSNSVYSSDACLDSNYDALCPVSSLPAQIDPASGVGYYTVVPTTKGTDTNVSTSIPVAVGVIIGISLLFIVITALFMVAAYQRRYIHTNEGMP